MGLMARHGQRDFDARSEAGPRVDDHRPADDAGAFSYGMRTAAARVEFVMGEPSPERKAAAIVLNRQRPGGPFGLRPDDHAVGAAVLAYVHQRLVNDARDLAADVGGERRRLAVRDEPGGYAGVAAEPVHDAAQVLHEIAGLD